MNVRAHVFVNGEVQGVFFRSRVKQEADTRNVKGRVGNRAGDQRAAHGLGIGGGYGCPNLLN